VKVVVTNIYGKENKGDQALLESLLSCLHSFNNVKNIFLHAHYTEGLGDYSDLVTVCKPVNNIEHRYKKLLIPFILLCSYFYAKFPLLFSFTLTRWQKKTVDSYRHADLIISCPGGFLEDSTKAYFAAIFQLFLASVFQKKLVIAPQSIGPINGRISKWLLRNVLVRAEKIYVREQFSYRFLKEEIGIPAQSISMSADMAFFYEYKGGRVEQVEIEDRMYSTVVDWNFPASDDKEAARELYIKSMAEFYKRVSDDNNVDVVILNQVSSDLRMARAIKNFTLNERLYIDESHYEPNEMIAKIGSTRFFVGTRFHSCIFAALANVPFIAISYLPKTHGIMEYLDLLGYEIDIYKISCDELLLKYQEMVLAEKVIKSSLQKTLLSIEEKNIFSRELGRFLNAN